jgi:anti-sigma-K factor RskA
MAVPVVDLLEMYCLGVLEDPERSEVRDALGRGESKRELARAVSLVTLFGLVLPSDAAPPAYLKDRVLSGFGRGQRTPAWLRAWAVASLVVIAVLGWMVMSERRRGDALVTDLARERETMAVMTAADTKSVAGGGTQIFANAKGVVLATTALPPAPSGKAYQMWLIRDGAKPEPAGLFSPVAGAAALHFLPGAIDLATLKTIAVTLEEAKGAQQPTSTPLIALTLQR